MRTTKVLFALAGIITTTTSTPTLPLPVTVLHTFPANSWAENLAVRSNGQLLIARLDTPAVYQIDPSNTTHEPLLVASWSNNTYKGALGIAESGDPSKTDVFYVVTSAFVDDAFVKTGGVNSVWELDLNALDIADNGTVLQTATLTKTADVSPADFLNGMVVLPNSTDLLVADAYAGVVYQIFTANGSYAVTVDDPKMKYNYTYSLSGTAPAINLGVNGLKLYDGYLYFSNTAAGTLNRIEVDSLGNPLGGLTAEIVSADVKGIDDFVIRETDGAAFVCQNRMDELSVVYNTTESGNEALVLAGTNVSTTLAGVTAAKFGRGADDKGRLYLTTSGAQVSPINGSVTVPATVAWVDTEGL